MKLTIQRSFFAACITLATILSIGTATNYAQAQAATGGRLRFVHGVPGAPAVDISIDDVLAVRNLAYATATRYLNVPAGDHTLAIAATGTTNTIFKGKVSVNPGQAQTVIVQGTIAAVELGVYEDDLGPLAPGNTRLTAIHAIKDAPAIDILKSDNSPLIQGLKYGAPYGGFDIPAGALGILVVPAGGDASAALVKDTLALVAGTHNVVVALGTVGGAVKPSYLLLTAATDADNPATVDWVSFVHAASGAQAVDIYAGDKLIAPALSFGSATPHIALDPKSGSITVRAAGSAASSAALATLTDLGLAVGGSGTLVISGADGNLTTTVAQDSNATLDAKTVRINVINVARGASQANAGTATLALNGKSLVSDPSKSSTSTELPAGTYDVSVTVDKPAIQLVSKGLALSGGVLYDLVVAGNDQDSKLIVVGTGINEQPSSVPAAPGTVVAQADTAVPAATDAAQPAQTADVQSTTAATAAALAPTDTLAPPTIVPTTAPVQPTTVPPTEVLVGQAPTVTLAAPDTSADQPTETLAPVQPTATPQGVVALVETNEGVNQKIRQYPSTDALTLFLVPSGESFTVLGVRGPVSKPGAAPTTAPTKGPTPTLSAANVTMDQIWLYVRYDVPNGGGSVTGWSNAGTLLVSNKGRNFRKVEDVLDNLSLKEIPADQVGENATSATAVPGDSNAIIGTIVNLADGVNANLRRTPGLDGEVLTPIPLNDQVVVLQQIDLKAGTPVVGSPDSTTWLFVRYTKDTGSYTGWITAQYVQLSRRGRKLDLDPTVVPVATGIQRGGTQGNVEPVKPPAAAGLIATVSNINQDTHLNLRRTPDANSESLVQIAAGEELQVEGRNGDGNWLKVQYQGQEGWINSEFVTITKNGKAYKIPDISIVTGEKDTTGIATPGPSPTATT